MMYSHKDYERNPFLATREIGRELNGGSLTLFLGAGVSSGFGLPDWPTLVARILGRGSDASYVGELHTKNDTDLARLIDAVDDGTEAYVDKVHGALYSDVPSILTDHLSRSPLLLSVGAMMTGACRGRITSVITYNYDDLLIQYLNMLGYSVSRRKQYNDLSTWADVEINYVHGYVPQGRTGASRPEDLILSERSYREKRAKIDEEWSSFIVHSLYSKIGLFLGLSGEDGSILDLLARARREIKRTTGYYGYWLMTPTSFDRNQKPILDVQMCPIKLDKNDLPKFVLQICQNALP
jgi:hypothetical protein